MSSILGPGRGTLGTAMLCAGLVTAQFIAGKAARDALYLAHLDVTSLPTMVIATSTLSIALVLLSAKVLRRYSPAVFVPLSFAASALLLLAEWGLTSASPVLAARVVYLQISGFGPLLGSGFWLIASERFDPRTAKRRFGQILGVGTMGGLLGGLLAERVAVILSVASMLPILAALNLLCAWQIRRLARPLDAPGRRRPIELSPDLSPAPARIGWHALARAPYLRPLAALVLLGAMGAELTDYVFKAEATAAFGRGETLLRFFAIYYAATSVLTFAVQTAASRLALEKLGLAASAGTPSMALLVGGAGALLVPGLQSAVMVRGGESVFRGSLFRSGYELFYTPISLVEKRAAKSIIDVGVDRLGDACGGGLIRLVLLVSPSSPRAALLVLAMGCAALALAVASRLNRGYMQTLERSLLNRAVELDLADARDRTTRTAFLRTLHTGRLQLPRPERGPVSEAPTRRLEVDPTIGPHDPDLADIQKLRSKRPNVVMPVLTREEGLRAALIPHVIPLLAWDPAAEAAVFALRKVAEERVGELVDALIDPNQPFAVRRRLARVFSVCVSQRAADGMMLGLEDLRFEVRFRCGRSIAAILEKNPRIRVDRDRTFDVIRREVAVSRPVWEGHRLLDRPDEPDQKSFADEVLKDRANQSLLHVFTLLSLVFPTEPLRVAFKGLHTDDDGLRGTALEYLEGILPRDIRDALWPFVDDGRRQGRTGRSREDVVAALLHANESIMLNLRDLERRHATESSDPAPRDWED